MSQKHHFRIGGLDLDLSKDGVEHKLATIKPQEIRKLYVQVKKKKFPVNQAFSAVAPELMKGEFQSHQALHVFKKLGFKVGPRGK